MGENSLVVAHHRQPLRWSATFFQWWWLEISPLFSLPQKKRETGEISSVMACLEPPPPRQGHWRYLVLLANAPAMVVVL
ncbi:hypothetical protein CDL15_Pgr016319 [Punica granatum]|uniref:Uncharacterized protein n=1 Tax=Punica granatum TaxID=22663 RepID=A0A218W6I5_PUNGR|nr:hypothetical protein CDL15_Pgr016319 [Punica granatum]